jgi:hypothetical protein
VSCIVVPAHAAKLNSILAYRQRLNYQKKATYDAAVLSRIRGSLTAIPNLAFEPIVRLYIGVISSEWSAQRCNRFSKYCDKDAWLER